jgi:hypothetical protein
LTADAVTLLRYRSNDPAFRQEISLSPDFLAIFQPPKADIFFA